MACAAYFLAALTVSVSLSVCVCVCVMIMNEILCMYYALLLLVLDTLSECVRKHIPFALKSFFMLSRVRRLLRRSTTDRHYPPPLLFIHVHASWATDKIIRRTLISRYGYIS